MLFFAPHQFVYEYRAPLIVVEKGVELFHIIALFLVQVSICVLSACDCLPYIASLASVVNQFAPRIDDEGFLIDVTF